MTDLSKKKVWSYRLSYWRFWNNPCVNKQHPTPAVYTLEQYMTMQVMNGLCLSLRICEFSRFPVKDKSEHFHLNM